VRIIPVLVGLAAVVALAAYYDFGTVSPCGALRASVRQQDGLAAVLPDSVIDLYLAAQYGALSPGRCLVILLKNPSIVQTAQQVASPPSPRVATAPAPVAVTARDPLQWAMQLAQRSADECRAKRVSGELPTYAASAQCSNPTMLAAFNEAHYRYMDLIQFFAAKRLELARRIDRGELSEQQVKLETTKAYTAIIEAERQRDSAVK